MVKKNKNNGICQAEGYEITCNGQICKAHILTGQCHITNTNEHNFIFICKNHELFFNRRLLYVWYRFIKEKFPEKFSYVISQFDLIMREYKYILEVAKER